MRTLNSKGARVFYNSIKEEIVAILIVLNKKYTLNYYFFKSSLLLLRILGLRKPTLCIKNIFLFSIFLGKKRKIGGKTNLIF